MATPPRKVAASGWARCWSATTTAVSSIYAGKVGTGFDGATLRALHKRLSGIEQDRTPFTRDCIRETGTRWVRAEVVVQVGFTEWTRDGKLRYPRYTGLRTDKDPNDVVRETR